jgi:amino-acid N-acetyltransferase
LKEPFAIVNAATAHDLPAIRDLLAAAGLPNADIDEAQLPGFVVLLAGDRVVGAAAVEALGKCGLLRSVVVAGECAGRGYGARLTEAAQNRAAARGLAPIYLLTTTAAGYFARHGYVRIDRAALPAEVRASREFTTLCPDTAIAMVRL